MINSSIVETVWSLKGVTHKHTNPLFGTRCSRRTSGIIFFNKCRHCTELLSYRQQGEQQSFRKKSLCYIPYYNVTPFGKQPCHSLHCIARTKVILVLALTLLALTHFSRPLLHASRFVLLAKERRT